MSDLKFPNSNGELLPVDTLTGFHGTSGIKLPTLNNYVDKARKEGWLKPAVNLGGSYLYFVEDLEKLQGMYGRKAAAKMIHPDQHETVVRDNVRLAAENVELESVIGLLNDRIDNLMKELSEVRAVALLEYENV